MEKGAQVVSFRRSERAHRYITRQRQQVESWPELMIWLISSPNARAEAELEAEVAALRGAAHDAQEAVSVAAVASMEAAALRAGLAEQSMALSAEQHLRKRVRTTLEPGLSDY